MNKTNITHHDKIVEKLASLSQKEFLDLGSDGLSYIKSMGVQDGAEVFALHAANGSHIATGQDMAVLHSIAGQNDLTPMSLQ